MLRPGGSASSCFPQGHVSVVTGGSRGIGAALARLAARRGSTVLLVGRDTARLDALRAELGTLNAADHRTLAVDLGGPDAGAALTDALAGFGRADLLIASAALGEGPASGERLARPTRDLALATFQRVIDVNLHGVFLAVQAVLPFMRAQGAGDIVAVGSSTTPGGLRGRPMAPAYCASKFALGAFMRTLAAEVGPEGVRVHSLYPGPVETPLIADTMLHQPFGGQMTPESFAETVLDLVALGAGFDWFDPHILPLPTRRPPLGLAG